MSAHFLLWQPEPDGPLPDGLASACAERGWRLTIFCDPVDAPPHLALAARPVLLLPLGVVSQAYWLPVLCHQFPQLRLATWRAETEPAAALPTGAGPTSLLAGLQPSLKTPLSAADLESLVDGRSAVLAPIRQRHRLALAGGLLAAGSLALGAAGWLNWPVGFGLGGGLLAAFTGAPWLSRRFGRN